MNDQAAQLTRWLLAGNGALKNVGALLTGSFGPTGAVAATIDAATIIAYPTDPDGARPAGDAWTPAPNGWSHPLQSALLPRSTSAEHHIIAGITSRNELLIINLAALDYLGIEGADPIPMMRSWLLQLLSKTPAAHIAVTDPALTIPGAPRLAAVKHPAAAPAGTTVVLSTQHTSPPTPGGPLIVSSQAAGAVNVVLCNESVAGIYLTNRYWPIWRRMQIAPPQWADIVSVLSAADAPTPPQEAAPVTAAASCDRDPVLHHAPAAPEDADALPAPPPAAQSSPDRHASAPPTHSDSPAPHAPATSAPPAGAPTDHPAPDAPPEQATMPARLDLTSTTDTQAPPAAPTPLLVTPPPPALDATETPTTNGHPLHLPAPIGAEEAPQVGLYALGETYAIGADPDTGTPIKHSAVTRQGVRKPIKALMVLATSSGLTTAEWDKELGFSPQNRRQARTQIRKFMGGDDPIREDARGLLVVDLFCDWKEFQRLTAPHPMQASDENLAAAVQLIRGAPFADIPEGDYRWRSVELLKDELLDRCSDAALELARRQLAAGDPAAAYRTARLGIAVYPQREDLWEVAATTVGDAERPGLIWDLKQAIPAPRTPGLRQLLAASRAH